MPKLPPSIAASTALMTALSRADKSSIVVNTHDVDVRTNANRANSIEEEEIGHWPLSEEEKLSQGGVPSRYRSEILSMETAVGSLVATERDLLPAEEGDTSELTMEITMDSKGVHTIHSAQVSEDAESLADAVNIVLEGPHSMDIKMNGWDRSGLLYRPSNFSRAMMTMAGDGDGDASRKAKPGLSMRMEVLDGNTKDKYEVSVRSITSSQWLLLTQRDGGDAHQSDVSAADLPVASNTTVSTGPGSTPGRVRVGQLSLLVRKAECDEEDFSAGGSQLEVRSLRSVQTADLAVPLTKHTWTADDYVERHKWIKRLLSAMGEGEGCGIMGCFLPCPEQSFTSMIYKLTVIDSTFVESFLVLRGTNSSDGFDKSTMRSKISRSMLPSPTHHEIDLLEIMLPTLSLDPGQQLWEEHGWDGLRGAWYSYFENPIKLSVKSVTMDRYNPKTLVIEIDRSDDLAGAFGTIAQARPPDPFCSTWN